MTTHIKIQGVTPRIQYTADGVLTSYSFPFAIFHSGDINVYLNNTLQQSSAYQVTFTPSTAGGTITFYTAPANGVQITIVRNLSIERTSDFQEGGTLRANTLNDELDYQIACQQQIADTLNRSLVLPPYSADTGVDLTLPSPSAGKAIVWNSNGTKLENSTVAVNALESTLNTYKTAAQNSATTAASKAYTATSQAQTATAQADIATTKAAEATAAANQLNGMRTNCITEIPQDINLELTEGVLTLKSGSKFYVPNGSDVFNTITVSSDLTMTSSSNGTKLLLAGTTGTAGLISVNTNSCVSGSSDSLADQSYHVWYDTANNLVKYYGSNGSTVSSNRSLPIAIITVSNGAISSINKVFNGIGYIGSTIFMLPGVKSFIPNGRNSDGTLKSTVKTTNAVITRTASSGLTGEYYFGHSNTNEIGMVPFANYSYNQSENINTYSGTLWRCAVIASATFTSGVISNFETKAAFHSADFHDCLLRNISNIQNSAKNSIIDWSMPDYKSTLSGVGNNYTAPKNGIYWFSVANTSAPLDIIITPNGGSATTYVKVYNDYGGDGGYQIHLGKGDKIKIGSGTVTMTSTYFIPLKGV